MGIHLLDGEESFLTVADHAAALLNQPEEGKEVRPSDQAARTAIELLLTACSHGQCATRYVGSFLGGCLVLDLMFSLRRPACVFCLCSVCTQINSQLVDTPGSIFLTEATALLAKEDFEAFLAKMLSHLDLVLSKSTEKGRESCTAMHMLHEALLTPIAPPLSGCRCRGRSQCTCACTGQDPSRPAPQLSADLCKHAHRQGRCL